VGAGAALDKLCRVYWYPLYAFVRRQAVARDVRKPFDGDFAGTMRGDRITSPLASSWRILHEEDQRQAYKTEDNKIRGNANLSPGILPAERPVQSVPQKTISYHHL